MSEMYLRWSDIKNALIECSGNLSENELAGMDVALSALEKLSAADVAPVVHGRWVPKYEIKEMYYSPDDVERYKVPNGFSCSQCGRAEYRREPYCNCGARMDGE